MIQTEPKSLGRRALLLAVLLGAILLSAGTGASTAAAQSPGPVEVGAAQSQPTASAQVVVLPFKLNSPNSPSFRTGTLDELLAERIETSGEVSVLAAGDATKGLGDRLAEEERSDEALRALASRLGIDAVVTGSLTELAGRFSLDVRLVPARRGTSGP